MKATFYWRVVFGASAMLSGVASLISPNSEMWQRLHMWRLPFAPVIAWTLAVALVAGGAAMMYSRTARIASIVLGAVFGLFTLACIPAMVTTLSYLVSYVDFFEQLSIVCGALAVYAATETNEGRSATLGRVVRVVFGVCVISFAWAQIVYLQHTMSLVPTWIAPNPLFWTILTTFAFGLAAVAILINYRARLALHMMALMLMAFGVLVWLPRIVAYPETLSNWTEFGANYLMSAASWLVADVRSF